MTTPPFAFFGTPQFAVSVLEEMQEKGFLPSVIVTAPEKPRGRNLRLSPTPVHEWSTRNAIPVLTPEKLDEETYTALEQYHCQFFVVAAYGKIIPQKFLDLAPLGALNVHPSLLPKGRGPSPIESVILSEDTATGVSIILLDSEVDHGPILAMRERVCAPWPPKASVLRNDLAHFGGSLLAEVLPEWLAGLTPTPQDHTRATFTKKIQKKDAFLDFSDSPIMNLKKIRAYDEWPGAFYFEEINGKRLRIRVTDAHIENGALVLDTIIPEGKKEMRAEDFFRNRT